MKDGEERKGERKKSVAIRVKFISMAFAEERKSEVPEILEARGRDSGLAPRPKLPRFGRSTIQTLYPPYHSQQPYSSTTWSNH